MTLLNTLQDEMKNAMKSRDQKRLDALRLIISAIRYVEVDTPNLSDEQILEVLKKEAKKRRESIEAYKSADRVGQAEQEQYELSVIEAYLPQMMTDDEVRELLMANSKQLTEAADFGTAMKIAMKVVAGKADGGVVAKIVKEMLAK